MLLHRHRYKRTTRQVDYWIKIVSIWYCLSLDEMYVKHSIKKNSKLDMYGNAHNSIAEKKEVLTTLVAFDIVYQ